MIEITRTFSLILDEWLGKLGLPKAATEASRNISSPPLTLSQWTEEVRRVVAHAPGPARGLEIGACVQLQHTGPLGYLVVNSRTLGELLATYLLLEKWFYGQNWASAITSEDQFEIAWDQRLGVPHRLIEQIHTSALLTLVRQACPTAGNPKRVEIMNDDFGEGHLYHEAFGCPVLFGRPNLRLVFPLAALQAPVDLDNVAVGSTWQNCQRTLREAHPNANLFVRAVQEAIMRHLPAGAPVDSVATDLNLSRRTLQRRLADAGCSYRQLLTGIRERHAACLLADDQLSLKDIAFLLGYSEQSAFNHAYKRWTGCPPLQVHH